MPLASEDEILPAVRQELEAAKFIDIHTHLFMPSLGSLGLWGIDSLLTYHYLEAEFFRCSTVQPGEYRQLSTCQKADLIWRTLFVENTPVSEAARGVIAVLHAFGLATNATDLMEAREFFRAQDARAHIDRVFALAGISEVVMTNDPLDPEEGPLWERGVERDPRFHAALRLDRILVECPDRWNIAELRRFLATWHDRLRPAYMAVSLPDTFEFPDDSPRGLLLAEAVLPACRDFEIPLSLMIGVRRQVNPALQLAGDASGAADLRALERLCVAFPDNRFLITILSRENQHELCIYARKFSNLMPFGCWWFLNNPSIVEEVTTERLEMLGTSFIPQHSDARVLEQLIYKWRNTRRTLAPVLANKYRLLCEDGRQVTRAAIRRDIHRLFRSNFERLLPGGVI
ncbi:MAG: glucuronate isomerase [Bryobacterales bacterium]|nr:glucuronate isomerase [Bryobacterales bacterium]MBV9398127.1 glucuronate isomerase [Bryobacterales bacterium]